MDKEEGITVAASISVLWTVAVKSYFVHLVAMLVSCLLLTDLAGYVVNKKVK